MCWAGAVGGRLKREGIYVYIELIHITEQQKLTQYCKAIILQLKHEKKKKNRRPCAVTSPPGQSIHTSSLPVSTSQALTVLS